MDSSLYSSEEICVLIGVNSNCMCFARVVSSLFFFFLARRVVFVNYEKWQHGPFATVQFECMTKQNSLIPPEDCTLVGYNYLRFGSL